MVETQPKKKAQWIGFVQPSQPWLIDSGDKAQDYMDKNSQEIGPQAKYISTPTDSGTLNIPGTKPWTDSSKGNKKGKSTT
jgi:hypothetical protein